MSAFKRAGPYSGKKTVSLTAIFALLGSAGVQVLCKMLMKLTPEEKKRRFNDCCA